MEKPLNFEARLQESAEGLAGGGGLVGSGGVGSGLLAGKLGTVVGGHAKGGKEEEEEEVPPPGICDKCASKCRVQCEGGGRRRSVPL